MINQDINRIQRFVPEMPSAKMPSAENAECRNADSLFIIRKPLLKLFSNQFLKSKYCLGYSDGIMM